MHPVSVAARRSPNRRPKRRKAGLLRYLMMRVVIKTPKPKSTCAPQRDLSLAGVQLVECALQLFKLLSSLAELAFRCQALVVGKVFGGLGDERVEIRRG